MIFGAAQPVICSRVGITGITRCFIAGRTGLAGQTQFTRVRIRLQNLEESVNDCGIPWEQTEWRVRQWICFGLCTQAETGRSDFSD